MADIKKTRITLSNRQALTRLLRAAGGHDVRHNVGIRTGLPDGAVDVVVITPRLSGIWEQFGNAILAEADRIGTQTRCLFDAGVSSGVS